MELEQKTLREWRESRGISQEFVAKALGVSNQTLRNKEFGISDFGLTQVRLLMKLYNIEFDQIVPNHY